MCICHSLRFSEHATDTSEDGRAGANSAEPSKALLECHHSLLVKVAIVRNLAVKHVASGTLKSKVELVLPEPGCGLAHPVVGPACVLRSVQQIVVLNSIEALLEDGRVEERVKCVA